jgi:hypothetical protein
MKSTTQTSRMVNPLSLRTSRAQALDFGGFVERTRTAEGRRLVPKGQENSAQGFNPGNKQSNAEPALKGRQI